MSTPVYNLATLRLADNAAGGATHENLNRILNTLASNKSKYDVNQVWCGDAVVLSTLDGAQYAAAGDRQGDEGGNALLELAFRAYFLLNSVGKTQSVIYSGANATTLSALFTDEMIKLSTSTALTSPTKRELGYIQQLQASRVVLASFGSGHHSTLNEMHFNSRGKLIGSKVLVWGLNKSILTAGNHHHARGVGGGPSNYQCFYQLVEGMGGVAEQADYHLLGGLAEYNLLAATLHPRPQAESGLDELKDALKILAFKSKHVASIFKLLSAILLLGNLEFADRGELEHSYESGWVVNVDVLQSTADLLGIEADELSKSLFNKARWIRQEMVSVILNAEAAARQRDSLIEALYSILFAFVVETINHKLFPGDEAIRVTQAAGGSSLLQLTTPASSTSDTSSSLAHHRLSLGAQGSLLKSTNGFEQFAINFSAETIHYWLTSYLFDSDWSPAARAAEDGIPFIDTPLPLDGSARLELLRGGRIGGKADRKPGGIVGGLAKTCASVRRGAALVEADEALLRGMRDHFGRASGEFIAAPTGPGQAHSFGIRHFAGEVVYDVRGFVERDLDALDAEFVAMLRGSEDGFVSKLFSGPSLAAEVHPLDERIIVEAQVSNSPLRRASPITLGHGEQSDLADADAVQPLLSPVEIHSLSTQLNANLSGVLGLLEKTQVWAVIGLQTRALSGSNTTLTGKRQSTSVGASGIDKDFLKAQLVCYNVPELIAKASAAPEFPVNVDYDNFAARFGLTEFGPEGVRNYLTGSGQKESIDYALGTSKVWLTFACWEHLVDRLVPVAAAGSLAAGIVLQGEGEEGQLFADSRAAVGGEAIGFSTSRSTLNQWGDLPSPLYNPTGGENSVDDLLLNSNTNRNANSPYNTNTAYPYSAQARYSQNLASSPSSAYLPGSGGGASSAFNSHANLDASEVWPSDKPSKQETFSSPAGLGTTNQHGPATVEVVPTSRGRLIWVAIVWSLTWWIPSFCLTHVGRMKRPDVRMAWREKVSLCILIGLFCGVVIFYIVVFGKLICPGFDNAWNTQQVSFHQGTNDYWVSVRGKVYDLTNYYKLAHSDIPGEPSDTADMLLLAGLDLTPYFPIPLTLACNPLVTDSTLSLQFTNFTAIVPTAVHLSGPLQPITSTALYANDWYTVNFLPKMRNYYKGPLVWAPNVVLSEAQGAGRMWAIYENGIYDLTDYFNTINAMPGYNGYNFLNANLTDLWQQEAGLDITSAINALKMDPTTFKQNMACITNLFYVGETDFRLTPKCQVQPYLLLTFSIILVATILAKFLAALQLGSKRSPEMRDKFVICQVPCYTEGEESLKQTIDSLATLTYDDKRKLLLIICDGMIIGSGNDRPTPRIVLDIFGVDQTVDPDPLMFKSVGEGSKQLNYGKVWSGLYEVDGHVVPYVVVAKVGRPSERSRPGNRGKRDSQILAMRFLNRVHFDSPMYPLELEMYHQIKNVIGVDPQLYEYMLVIDADTSVAADSLNRLVSCAADDSRIIGICGETKLSNEQESWWTMIQVYEYFISHHMSKAFESLFGTVTCLPGCFTMYRIRSADKGKPLLVSSLIIDEYSDCNLDTLHKKNLLALGEDRYLTTLILKHFPNYKTKFTADAQAMTVAPDQWSILLSQRRRWINSTVHNLAELMFLPNMCGFCCFGMRFIVVIDLVGTLILPATFVYLMYLIITVATGTGAIPLISLIMLGAVYGLQAMIFLIKRQWQFIGWLVIYILAYPIYSFILPVYSFWCFDDFTWGSTRVVVGEGKSKKILSTEDEVFHDSMIPTRKFSEYQAALDDDDKHSIHSMESRRTASTAGFSLATKMAPSSYHGGQDYYRDTKVTHSRMGSRVTSMAFPPPSMGYGGGAGSVHASAYGGSVYGGSPQAASEFGGYPIAGAGYNMPPTFSRASMMSFNSPQSMPTTPLPRPMSNMSGFNNMMPRPMSTYSLNPFAPASHPAPPVASDAMDPSDADVVATLRHYLVSQDLMTVTKRSAREAVQALYPRADLTSRRDLLNSSIDSILSGGL